MLFSQKWPYQKSDRKSTPEILKKDQNESFPSIKDSTKVKDPNYSTFSPERIAKKTLIHTNEKENLNHRVPRLIVEEDAKEEMEASLIALARGKIKVLLVLDKLRKDGFYNIKVKEIHPPSTWSLSHPSMLKMKWTWIGWTLGFIPFMKLVVKSS